jgi:hypothetical protein
MKQNFVDCENCFSGHKGDHTCKLSSDTYSCMAGIPRRLAQNVLGVNLYQQLTAKSGTKA